MSKFEDLTEGRSPILLALLTVLAGFVAGGILIGLDHVVIGIFVALGAIPAGLAVWVSVG